MINLIVTLDQAKRWLRLEPDFVDEDELIEDLVNAAEIYLLNATGNQFDGTNPLAKLFCRVLVADWYENRDMIGRTSDKVRLTVDSILAQLSHCYEPPAEEETT